jgi:hypothetical protein
MKCIRCGELNTITHECKEPIMLLRTTLAEERHEVIRAEPRALVHEAAIQAAIDHQIELERKAAAWDSLMLELQQVVHDDTPITPTLFRIIKTAAERQH